MAFDPLSWAIGFTLTRTATRVLRRTDAETFSDRLRKRVIQWSRSLPAALSDLHPEAIAGRLFEADCEPVGPERQRLQECFAREMIPDKEVWFAAICERRQEVHDEMGRGAQRFFLADSAAVEPHIERLAEILHRVCIQNEGFFKVTLFAMVGELLERDSRRETPLPRRARPADGLGVLHAVPALPDKFVARPEYSGPLRDKLLAGKGKAVAVTAAGKRKVGVQGMGGIGKTVLAAAAVRQEQVRRAFPDGVFWLTFGQQPNLLARQVQLAKWLGDERATFEDTQQGRARLEDLLRDSSCLVVLDDIWDPHHVQPFDAVGDGSRLLITTRFRNVVAAVGAEEQRLDVLPDDQALALLAQWAGTSVAALPPEAPAVVKECGGLPLALAMIGAMIQRRPERWDNALQRLRQADIGRIRQDFPDYPYPDLLRAIEVSIDGLDEIKDRYLDFAVFPEDTPIPEAVLHTLWGADGLDEDRVQDVLDTLEDRSMLRRDEVGRITLHDLQVDYVRNRVGEKRAGFQRRLLAAYRRCCPDGWHDGPDDRYFYQHVAYHLRESGSRADLKRLLFDYRWLRKKLEVTDANGLMADYDLAPDDSQAVLVQGAIRLSSHILAQDRSHLPGQLVGRLLPCKGNRIKTLLTGLEREEEAAWLRPLAPTLTPPGGPLRRTLRGHEHPVAAVAVTPDGRSAVSGSWDNTLKVWDLQTGKAIARFAADAAIPSCAVAPDGLTIIAGDALGCVHFLRLENVK